MIAGRECGAASQSFARLADALESHEAAWPAINGVAPSQREGEISSISKRGQTFVAVRAAACGAGLGLRTGRRVCRARPDAAQPEGGLRPKYVIPGYVPVAPEADVAEYASLIAVHQLRSIKLRLE